MDAWLLIYEKVPRWTGDIAAAAAAGRSTRLPYRLTVFS